MKAPWNDFYKPMDFFAKAHSYAKKFCKRHPEADSETVFYAASEAAFIYEGSMKYRHIKFWRFVYAAIKNAIYIKNRKEKFMEETKTPERTGKQRISDEVRAQIKTDLASGMKRKLICEKYGVSPAAVQRLGVELKGKTPEKKKKPAPDKPETDINKNSTTNIILPATENVKSFSVDFVDICSVLEIHLMDAAGDCYRIDSCEGSNKEGFARIRLTGRDGRGYVLEFRRGNNG